MAWGQWMIVEWTLEEELKIEAQTRIAFTHDDIDGIRKLCASLIRQNAYYERVLRQATGHIAEIETAAMLAISDMEQDMRQQHNRKPAGLFGFWRR